jgi:nitrogen fixation NifU-like protein
MYTEKVMEHFRNPRNYGRMENPDAIGKVGNTICGDVMWLYLRIKDDVIADIKFETFGCTAAIATSSMITDLAKGKNLSEALEITNQRVTNALGGLPPVKMHCSVLAAEALNEAIYDYLTKNGRDVPERVMKVHERVRKDMEKIKTKYKEFVDFEKDLHECGSCAHKEDCLPK